MQSASRAPQASGRMRRVLLGAVRAKWAPTALAVQDFRCPAQAATTPTPRVSEVPASAKSAPWDTSAQWAAHSLFRAIQVATLMWWAASCASCATREPIRTRWHRRAAKAATPGASALEVPAWSCCQIASPERTPTRQTPTATPIASTARSATTALAAPRQKRLARPAAIRTHLDVSRASHALQEHSKMPRACPAVIAVRPAIAQKGQRLQPAARSAAPSSMQLSSNQARQVLLTVYASRAFLITIQIRRPPSQCAASHVPSGWTAVPRASLYERCPSSLASSALRPTRRMFGTALMQTLAATHRAMLHCAMHQRPGALAASGLECADRP